MSTLKETEVSKPSKYSYRQNIFAIFRETATSALAGFHVGALSWSNKNLVAESHTPEMGPFINKSRLTTDDCTFNNDNNNRGKMLIFCKIKCLFLFFTPQDGFVTCAIRTCPVLSCKNQTNTDGTCCPVCAGNSCSSCKSATSASVKLDQSKSTGYLILQLSRSCLNQISLSRASVHSSFRLVTQSSRDGMRDEPKACVRLR